MTEISQELLNTMREEMNSSLKEIADKHGVLIQGGNTVFSSTDATMKLRIVALPEGENAESVAGKSADLIKAETDWDKKAVLFNLHKDWKGKTFTDAGREVTIVGLIPRRHKYPVLVSDNTTGKMFVLPTATINHAMGKGHSISQWIKDTPVRDMQKAA